MAYPWFSRRSMVKQEIRNIVLFVDTMQLKQVITFHLKYCLFVHGLFYTFKKRAGVYYQV